MNAHQKHPHGHHHRPQEEGSHTEVVVRSDSGGKASWVAVSGLVIAILSMCGGVATTVYQRGTNDAAITDLNRRMVSIEADGGRYAQLNAQRISSLEGTVVIIKADQAQMAAKMATQGERLAEINGKLDTLLERTRPTNGQPAR